MGQRLLLTVLLAFLAVSARAQNYVFAHLDGFPVDFTDWTRAGACTPFDSRGDADNQANEVLLVGTQGTFNSGAVFYDRALDLSSCAVFEAEFDFRLFDGNIGPTGADGMAFCFLTEPPRGFLTGGGVGIPPRPEGLMVVMDQWCNCCSNGGAGAQKIEIRYGNGRDDYQECPSPAQPTAVVTNLRQNNYQHLRVRYDNGAIQVFLNGGAQPLLTGNYRIDFPGFIGFTAATGSRVDNHSIRNVQIRSVEPITPPEAGPDVRICSGGTATLGAGNSQNPNLIYSWFPTTGVQSPAAGTTQISLVNTQFADFSRNYFITKDSMGRVGGCSSSDAVRVTVTGTGLDLPAALSGCDGQTLTIPFNGVAGYEYQWLPDTAIANPGIANTPIRLHNPTGQPIVRRFRLRARASQYGCLNWALDSVAITIGPAPRRAGLDQIACPGDSIGLGLPKLGGATYTWFPAEGLSDPNLPTPTYTAVNDSTIPLIRSFILSTTVGGCTGLDTVLVRVNPRPALAMRSEVIACTGNEIFIGDTVSHPGNTYAWAPAGFLNDGTAPRPILTDGAAQIPGQTRFIVSVTNPGTICTRTDTVTVTIRQTPVSNAGPPDTLCAREVVSLGDPGLPGVTYTWSPAAFLSDSAVANPQLQSPDDTANVRILTYHLTASQNGCQATDSVQITSLPRPIARILPFGPPCTGDSLHLTAIERPGYSYLWPLAGNQVGPRVAIFPQVVGVTFDESVIVTNQFGCRSRDSVRITPNNPPLPLAGGDVPVCPRDTITLGTRPVAGLMYQWQPMPGLLNQSAYNPRYAATTFSTDSAQHVWAVLTVVDTTTGCRRLDSALITINQAPKAYAGPDRMICPGTIGVLGTDSIPGQTYAWVGGPLSADASYLNVVLGGDTALYSVPFIRISTLGGCSLPDTVLAIAAPKPGYTPIIHGRPSICPGLSSVYNLTGAPANLTYTWAVDGGTLVPHPPAQDTISVDWGTAPRPDASVTVTAFRTTDTLTCSGDSVRLTVVIDSILRAPLPHGPLCINLSNDPSGFSVDSMPGSTYVWGLSGPATILNGQGTDSITVRFERRQFVRIWINEQINNTACTGPSDTIRIRVMTALQDTGRVTGPIYPCPGDTALFSFNRAYNDTWVEWYVPRGITSLDSLQHYTTLGDSLLLTFDKHLSGNIIAFETSPEGCQSTHNEFYMKVAPAEATWMYRTDSIVCPDFLTQRSYHIANAAGMSNTYAWQVIGGTIRSDDGYGQITVDWGVPPYVVIVTPTTSYGCVGKPDSLFVKVDASRIRLIAVSHVEDNNQDLLFHTQLASPFGDGKREGVIEYLNRSQQGSFWSTWVPFTYQPGGNSLLRVNGQYQPEWRYAFRLNSRRACNELEISEPASPIYLQVQGDQANGNVEARFSPHRGPEALGSYRILRRSDAKPWAFVQAASEQDTILSLPNDGWNGFQNCYRIVAEAGNDALILSNWACLSFEGTVFIPNIVTPNGDGVNDRLEPGSLPLYAGKYTLEIFNRWGRPVLKTGDYSNDWPAADTAPGTYFYRFVYPKGKLKGWIEVTK